MVSNRKIELNVIRVRSLRFGYFAAMALVVVAALLFSGFLPDTMLGDSAKEAREIPLFMWFFGALPALAYAWAADKGATQKRTRIATEHDGLRAGDEFLPRSMIRNVWVVPTQTGQFRLRIERRGHVAWTFVTPSREEAWSIADALGFGAQRGVARLWTSYQDGAWACGYVILLAVAASPVVATSTGAGGIDVRNFPAVALAAISLALLMVPIAGWLTGRLCRVEVGRDGLRIRRWLWERFIGFGEVCELREERGHRRLATNDGRSITIAPTLELGTLLPTPSNQRRLALAERIRVCLEAYQAREAVAPSPVTQAAWRR